MSSHFCQKNAFSAFFGPYQWAQTGYQLAPVYAQSQRRGLMDTYWHHPISRSYSAMEQGESQVIQATLQFLDERRTVHP